LQTPVYKKGPKYLNSNYRLISLTSVISKVMDIMVLLVLLNSAATIDIIPHACHLVTCSD